MNAILPIRLLLLRGGYNPLRMPFIIDEDGDVRAAGFWPYPGNNMEDPPELPDLDWSEREQRLISSVGGE